MSNRPRRNIRPMPSEEEILRQKLLNNSFAHLVPKVLALYEDRVADTSYCRFLNVKSDARVNNNGLWYVYADEHPYYLAVDLDLILRLLKTEEERKRFFRNLIRDLDAQLGLKDQSRTETVSRQIYNPGHDYEIVETGRLIDVPSTSRRVVGNDASNVDDDDDDGNSEAEDGSFMDEEEPESESESEEDAVRADGYDHDDSFIDDEEQESDYEVDDDE